MQYLYNYILEVCIWRQEFLVLDLVIVWLEMNFIWGLLCNFFEIICKMMIIMFILNYLVLK